MADVSGDNNAGGCIRPHLRVLRAVGFCRLAPLPAGAAPTAARRLHAAYHVWATCITSTYVLQQLIYAYQEFNLPLSIKPQHLQKRIQWCCGKVEFLFAVADKPTRDQEETSLVCQNTYKAISDMEKLSRVLFVLLCHVTCVAKQVVFHVEAANVDAIIAALDEPLFNGAEKAAVEARLATARGAARLLRAYAGCAEATCVLWTALAVATRARHGQMEMPFWTGFPYDHPLFFLVVQCYSFYATSLVAVGNTTMDAFIATIFDQCKTQLAIVCNNFKTITVRAKASAERSGRDFDAVLREFFVDSLLHYQRITECCSLLERVFGTALLVQFGVGGWILCMAAYKIVSLDVLSLEFASTTLFITCILTELLLYCYYGNEVAVESERVSSALYGMEWTVLDVRFRRALLIAMTCAQKPLRPTAGRVIPLTLETYVTILKSSYSFYAVLRQTNQVIM